MAKPRDYTEKQTWGTWEDLLLTCAVHRYGTDSWDSVAVEIQKRSASTEAAVNAITAQSCKQKFHDLKHRFSKTNAIISVADDATATGNNIPWLEELRKLRVAELKQELERYDLSIVSLQLKVNRLKEEREENGRSDLEKAEREKEGEREKDGNVSPEKLAAGEDSDRDNRSVNESNSTDPKPESPGTGQEEEEGEKTEPVQPTEPACGKADRTGGEVVKLRRGGCGEDSCNSVAEESERVDSGEWVAESKSVGGEGEDGKDSSNNNSDEQSWASLSRKEEKSVEPLEAVEPDNSHPSRAIRSVPVESQPLADFLEMLRSHKLGSLFERRLETQETSNYANLIRQHVDLETVRVRLEEGWYSSCKKRFFRDLLLLLNNAVVFFDNKSAESSAAIELREIVSKELAKIPAPEPLPKEESTVSNKPEPTESLVVKPKMRVLMIACRKRSPLATKASPLYCGADKKRDQKASSTEDKPSNDLKQHDKVVDKTEEKPVVNLKQQDTSADKAEENRVTKKRMRERLPSGSRSTNKNSRSKNGTKTNKNSDANSNTGLVGKAGSQTENSESKSENKRSAANASSKKKGAASFLDRMKRNSPSSNGSLLESLKNSVSTSDNGKGTEQKRNANTRREAKNEQNSRKGSGGKRTRDSGSRGQRSKGRPPKRAAAPPPAPAVVGGKRGREAGGAEAGASGHAKKRSRK